MSRKPLKYRWMEAWRSEKGPRTTVRLLLAVLFTHMDKNGRRCFPGSRLLEDETGLSRSALFDAIRDAEAGGWIRIEKKRGGRRGGEYNTYWPDIPVELNAADYFEPESGTGAEPVGEEGGSGTADDESGTARGQNRYGSRTRVVPGSSHEISHGNFPPIEKTSSSKAADAGTSDGDRNSDSLSGGETWAPSEWARSTARRLSEHPDLRARVGQEVLGRGPSYRATPLALAFLSDEDRDAVSAILASSTAAAA